MLIILVQTSSTDTQLLMQEAIHFLVAAVTTVCLLGFPLLPPPLHSSCSGQRRGMESLGSLLVTPWLLWRKFSRGGWQGIMV